MKYLNSLVNSKQEIMKRKMIDLIDGIHKTEREELKNDFAYMKPEMDFCERINMEPVNFDVHLLKKKEENQLKLEHQ